MNPMLRVLGTAGILRILGVAGIFIILTVVVLLVLALIVHFPGETAVVCMVVVVLYVILLTSITIYDKIME